jgi:hypothetical protein
VALEPHEFKLLTDIAAETSSLHNKVDGLYNQRFEDISRQKDVCDRASNSRKELHAAVQEYRSDKKLTLAILKYTGVIAPAAYAVVMWLRKHGVNI